MTQSTNPSPIVMQHILALASESSAIKNQEPVKPVTHVHQKIIDLADAIDRWHKNRPVLTWFKPIQLGRLAAALNKSREDTAAALTYLGWHERRAEAKSLWLPSFIDFPKD